MRWIGRSAARSMIRPPMLEPTRICGPSASELRTVTASSTQRPIAPDAMAPLDAPWPKIVGAHESLSAAAAIILDKRCLGSGHVGSEPA
jgi:hypothetical protein